MARGPGDDRRRWLADDGLPDARTAGRSTAGPTSRTRRATACRASGRSSRASIGPGASERAEHRGRRARLVAALAAAGAGAPRRRASPTAGRCSTRRSMLIERGFDPRNGGWGGAPKFPQPMTIEFLLRRAGAPATRGPCRWRGGPSTRWPTAGSTTSSAAGFHRYATDAVWLVPALRADALRQRPARPRVRPRLALTGDARYRDVADGTLDYLLRELRTADGAFAASQDADTDGDEGATFIWRADEVRERPRRRTPRCSRAAYGVTDGGNWEGAHDPVAGPDRRGARRAVRTRGGEVDGAAGGGPGALLDRLADAAAAGARRQGARGLERACHRGPRRRGPVARRWRRATRLPARIARPRRPPTAILPALLDADGRLRAVVEGRPRHRRRASSRTTRISPRGSSRCTRRRSTSAGSWPLAQLADAILERFADPAGGFFDTSDDHETARDPAEGPPGQRRPVGQRDGDDRAARLAAFTGEGRYRTAAERALAARRRRPGAATRAASPSGSSALDFALADVVEVAIVGEPDDAGDAAAAGRRRGPGSARAWSSPRRGRPGRERDPAARGSRFRLDGRPTAYVCRKFACRLPVTEPEALRRAARRGLTTDPPAARYRR